MPTGDKWIKVVWIGLLSGCGTGGELSQADVARADALYVQNCAACHDKEGSGAASRAALRTRTPGAIIDSLETGLMREQGKPLSVDERKLIAAYLGSGAQASAGKKCDNDLALAGRPLWNGWGNGVTNQRYQPASATSLTATNVGQLELKWAFGFPGAARARSQPVVTDEALFTGSQDGRVYALGLANGCTHWTFDAEAEVRVSPTLGLDKGGRPDRLYVGDFKANVYAIDARTGKQLWKRSVADHPAGTITGSPTVHGGRIFVPMSSTEIVSAMDENYACCSFRGGVAALDAATGTPLWRVHTTDVAEAAGTNRKGKPARGPSGAPVWSPPTVDAKRGLVYFGTGENYSSPANDKSDAIIAVEMETGKIRWVRQVLANDAWNGACIQPGVGANCPREDGPDLDFGAPPILAQTVQGDVLLAGQKSGLVFGIDPESGKILWQRRAGAGGFNGGIHWGMASDGPRLFVGIADTPGGKAPVGPRRPGVHAFASATGKPIWSVIEPQTCPERAFKCETAFSAPVTLAGAILLGGTHNGLIRAYAADTGRLLWSYDTIRDFITVNGVKARGGSIDSAGPVVAGGYLIVNSGYDKFNEIPGNVLLVFGPKKGKGT
ncbi:MAG: PQQ-binding-like beta-propeller repeat protein [Sphingopyxis sp.]|nr:PQQ-binding-like beta-propeller repeat protein [Sphingopyxis sp.]